MMVYDNMREAVYDRLLSFFPTIFGAAVPIGFENQKFEQPKNAPFLLGFFRYNPSRRASIGTVTRFNRHNGVFVVECSVPEKTGTATVWKMAGAVADIFDSKNFQLADGSDVTTKTPSVYPSGRSQDGFYLISVIVPFQIDSVGGQ